MIPCRFTKVCKTDNTVCGIMARKHMQDAESKSNQDSFHAPLSSITTSSPDLESGIDLYKEAVAQLKSKVGHVITQADYESFTATVIPCTTMAEARNALTSCKNELQIEHHSSFFRFFKKLNALFEPLRLFKDALDTLCQVDSASCLVWGSLKVLIQVRYSHLG